MLIRGRQALVAAIAAAATVCAGCGTSTESVAGDQTSTVITSTTKIAGTGVLGNLRRPDESCAPEPERPDPDESGRTVRHAAGVTEVPPDPQRIVVLSDDQLDDLCALGLQTRIVGAATAEGSSAQPSYLGTVIHDLPALGTLSAPDLAGIAAARPDLILGSEALTPDAYPTLSAIAPTVFSGAPGAAWEDNLRIVGAATARSEATGQIIDGFRDQAEKTGIGNDAAHFQVSVVQFTQDTMRVYGADNFPGSVLADVGVDRPAAQRFTDKPYLEIGTSDPDLDEADFSPAEGDIVYVSFASPQAKDQAAALFESDPWRALSASRDNRVFAVNNEVWQTGRGIVAARGMLDDLRYVNAPIN